MSGLKSLVRKAIPRSLDSFLVKSIDQIRLSRSPPLCGVEYNKLRSLSENEIRSALAMPSTDSEWKNASSVLFHFIPSGEVKKPGASPVVERKKAPAGWCNVGDRRAIFNLIRYFKPRSVLEIGTYVGSSTASIAAAMRLNTLDGRPGSITTVDIVDVNAADGPWHSAGLPAAPKDTVAATGFDDVKFVSGDAKAFLRETRATYDFIFLDGSHQASDVYCEAQISQRILAPDGVVLLHDFFPNGEALWPGSPPLPGPQLAIDRLLREGAPLLVIPLGTLPWPTKAGTNITSLAVLTRQ
jgi:predicted O-methyltransferase YrrM